MLKFHACIQGFAEILFLILLSNVSFLCVIMMNNSQSMLKTMRILIQHDEAEKVLKKFFEKNIRSAIFLDSSVCEVSLSRTNRYWSESIDRWPVNCAITEGEWQIHRIDEPFGHQPCGHLLGSLKLGVHLRRVTLSATHAKRAVVGRLQAVLASSKPVKGYTCVSTDIHEIQGLQSVRIRSYSLSTGNSS